MRKSWAQPVYVYDVMNLARLTWSTADVRLPQHDRIDIDDLHQLNPVNRAVTTGMLVHECGDLSCQYHAHRVKT